MKRSVFILIMSLLGLIANAENFMPDTDGNHINAHGGGILEQNGLYFWYGENRGMGGGVRVYSSTDLKNWTDRGLALETVDIPGHDIEYGCNIERPKVIYNQLTDTYVMWFHLELKDQGYSAARAAVAVAATPIGPFRFVTSGRVNPGVSAENCDTTTFSDYYRRDIDGGQMARDMTVYVDDDGRAYHIYSSEENYTLQIAELTPDYRAHTGKYIRVAPGGHNEAPAIFKHNGRYWMITSGCTGWEPNAARLHTADNIMGPWRELPNPCRGKDAEKTFGAQSTYALTLPDETVMILFDIWNPADLRNSGYLWIPVEFDSEGVPQLSR